MDHVLIWKLRHSNDKYDIRVRKSQDVTFADRGKQSPRAISALSSVCVSQDKTVLLSASQLTDRPNDPLTPTIPTLLAATTASLSMK